MQRRALLGGVAVGSAVALAGCSTVLFENRVEETRELEFDPGADLAVGVRADNGDVDVETHGGEQVVVDATVSAPSEERLEDATIDGDASDGEFVVAVQVDGDSSRVSVALDVQVPEGAEMASVQSDNGDVEVRDVASVAATRSSNGDVTVRDVGQSGSVTTENGDVAADVPAPLPGDVTVRSENGDVAAWLSPDADAELRATTDNGDVTVEDLDLADRQESETAVRGVLGEGTHEVACSTVNGDVTVSRWTRAEGDS